MLIIKQSIMISPYDWALKICFTGILDYEIVTVAKLLAVNDYSLRMV